MPLPAWTVWGAAVALLLGIHLIASSGSFTLAEPRLSQIGITPATTLTHWWRHLWAGLFHTTPLHIVFNLALFTAAFFFATNGHDPLRTLLGAYWIGPVSVFLLHLILVLPLAHAGLPYAVSALDRPLVGFSVITYAVVGMALAQAPLPWMLGLSGLVVAFEVVGGAVLQATGPFIFVYHLVGFGLGFLARRVNAV